MNKYDYVTVTIDEEKVRLEKLIAYLEKEEDYEELTLYKERYNNILKYLTARDKYLQISNSIESERKKLEKYFIKKEEYAVDNILLEDTILSKFNEDTNNIYRNLLYEDIKNESFDIRDILYLLFEKETEYKKLVIKREKLSRLLDKDRYPKTYDTLVSQELIINKQEDILDEIFILENNIMMKEKKLDDIRKSIMTLPILKLLYEFCIIDSYEIEKVNKNNLFNEKSNIVVIKEKVELYSDNDKVENINDNNEQFIQSNDDENMFLNLHLPDNYNDLKVDIDGKKYINNIE